MLTDDEIRELRDKANASFALCEVDPRNLDELCTRVLEAEAKLETVYAVADERLARIKVLESALAQYPNEEHAAVLEAEK